MLASDIATSWWLEPPPSGLPPSARHRSGWYVFVLGKQRPLRTYGHWVKEWLAHCFSEMVLRNIVDLTLSPDRKRFTWQEDSRRQENEVIKFQYSFFRHQTKVTYYIRNSLSSEMRFLLSQFYTTCNIMVTGTSFKKCGNVFEYNNNSGWKIY